MRGTQQKEYITTSQAAKLLGISRIAVYKRIKRGDIKAEKIGKIYAIPTSYVQEIFGHTLSQTRKRLIAEAVLKAVKEYGEVLLKLGNE